MPIHFGSMATLRRATFEAIKVGGSRQHQALMGYSDILREARRQHRARHQRGECATERPRACHSRPDLHLGAAGATRACAHPSRIDAYSQMRFTACLSRRQYRSIACTLGGLVAAQSCSGQVQMRAREDGGRLLKQVADRRPRQKKPHPVPPQAFNSRRVLTSPIPCQTPLRR